MDSDPRFSSYGGQRGSTEKFAEEPPPLYHTLTQPLPSSGIGNQQAMAQQQQQMGPPYHTLTQPLPSSGFGNQQAMAQQQQQMGPPYNTLTQPLPTSGNQQAMTQEQQMMMMTMMQRYTNTPVPMVQNMQAPLLDVWMPPPYRAPDVQPGLEYLMAVNKVNVEMIFNPVFTMSALVSRLEFKIKNSQGLLMYRAVREVSNFDCCENPVDYNYSIFDCNNMEVIRVVLTGGGCCSGSWCACLRGREARIESPPGNTVAEIEQKCSIGGIHYIVDRLGNGDILHYNSTSCLFCFSPGQQVDFTITEEKSGNNMGTMGKTSDVGTHRVMRTYSYEIIFDDKADAKTRAVLLGTGANLAAFYYESRGSRQTGTRRH